jgi:alpha-mannosidase
MKEKTVYMIGNAHIDPVWLWQWSEGFHEVRATFRSVLDRMKEYEEFVFVSSSAAYYEWVEKSDPAMFAEIRQRIAEGRWQVVGGWWVQPDCNLPGGESFARQALYAQHYFKEKFGVTAKVGYNVDSFGHHAMLPQLLKKSGLDYYVFLRPMPHEKGLPGRLFWWEADDGSRVLAFRIPFEYGTWGKDLEPHVRRCAAEIKAPFSQTMCFFGVGNHGGGPTRENLDSIRRMQADPDFPNLVISTPEQIFHSLETSQLPIPVVHDDLQHHASGCYAAHSGVKRWNRHAENLLLAAEKFSSIAERVTGQPYPADFAQAWKDVLFNQFHDILAGTSLEAAYEDARDLYGEANTIAGRALNVAIQSLAWQIRTPTEPGTTPIVVFNPHAWRSRVNVELEYTRLLETDGLVDDAGRPVALQKVQSQASANGRSRLSFVADLPPMGYRTYRVVPHAPAAQTRGCLAGDDFLENDWLRLEIDRESGAIKRLLDKRLEGEAFAGPAALPVVIDDQSDTWSHNVFHFDQANGAFWVQRMRLVEHGPVKSALRVTSTYNASRLVQEFILYADLPQIDVRVSLDWHEQFKALKLRFPMNLTHMVSTTEIPYGHIVRFANGEEEPGQSWIDLSGMSRDGGAPYGMSLLNDSKYSYDVNIRDIGMTILRSPIYAHHMPLVPDPEGDYTFVDQGPQHFRYTLLPHLGSWEKAGAVQRAAELNQPPIPLLETYHPEGKLPLSDSFLSVESDHVQASALKKAEDGQGWVLRLVETSGEAGRVRLCLNAWQRSWEVDFVPSEIKTFYIPADPDLPVHETNLLEWTD